MSRLAAALRMISERRSRIDVVAEAGERRCRCYYSPVHSSTDAVVLLDVAMPGIDEHPASAQGRLMRRTRLRFVMFTTLDPDSLRLRRR